MYYTINKRGNETIKWLRNAVIILIISELYAIIPTLPGILKIDQLITSNSFLQTSFIIHINLSNIIWCCSVAAMFWSLTQFHTNLEIIWQSIALLGVILIAISPLNTNLHPIMNSNLPMIENILFILGLASFGVALLLNAFFTIITSFLIQSSNDGERLIKINNIISATMLILVWLCFYLSYLGLGQLALIVPLDIEFYYDTLYWSGSYLLQFFYIQLFMFCLLILTEKVKNQQLLFTSFYELLFAFHFFLSLGILFGHYRFNIADGNFKQFFTLYVTYTSLITPTLLIFLLLFELGQAFIQKTKYNFTPIYLNIALLSSIFFFLLGGAMSITIFNIHPILPAIIIAMMGVIYLIIFTTTYQLDQITVILTIWPNIQQNLKKYSRTKLSRQNHCQIIQLAAWQMSLMCIGQLSYFYGLYTTNQHQIYSTGIDTGKLVTVISSLIFASICVRNLFFLESQNISEKTSNNSGSKTGG